MRIAGTIANKQVVVIDEVIPCSEDDVIKFIKCFSLLSILRAISDISIETFNKRSEIFYFHGFPITDDFLIFSANFILNNSPVGKKVIDSEHLLFFFRLTRYLFDQSLLDKTKDPDELLIVYSNSLFLYQESYLNNFGRILYIYKYLWDEIAWIKANDLFNYTFGITFDDLLVHFSILLSSTDSYFYKLSSKDIGELNLKLFHSISLQSQNKFLSWLSATIEELISYSGSLANPLVKFPIINTQIIPPGSKDYVYLIISKKTLFLKFSYSLYYDFIEKFRDGAGNKFKDTFGIVFQAYVGVLLKEHFTKWQIYPEFKYRKSKNSVDSVDWILCKDDKCVLIEIKQSSIFLNTKQTGSMESLQDDLKKTIVKAASQLKRTEEDIISHQYSELLIFNRIKYIQKICVVADQFYFGHYYINKLYNQFRDLHIINISDFENLLLTQKKSEGLFFLLKQKNDIPDYSLLDFKEYYVAIQSKKKGKRRRVKILDDVVKEYFENIIKK